MTIPAVCPACDNNNPRMIDKWVIPPQQRTNPKIEEWACECLVCSHCWRHYPIQINTVAHT